jgi:photosystem II stability/assembly factor-like uncharacterized protein
LERQWFSELNLATAGGSSATILRTTDGGATWVPQNSGTTSVSFLGVSFPDASTATVVRGDGTILRWTDGGGD